VTNNSLHDDVMVSK